jgi:hypothetical protein
MSGFELQDQLIAVGRVLPIVFRRRLQGRPGGPEKAPQFLRPPPAG